uniref:Uncharacterized protein n=2 Tax=Arion vulgaris TaxID=1028688 RepID=A0A0B7BI71_9EUPU
MGSKGGWNDIDHIRHRVLTVNKKYRPKQCIPQYTSSYEKRVVPLKSVNARLHGEEHQSNGKTGFHAKIRSTISGKFTAGDCKKKKKKSSFIILMNVSMCPDHESALNGSQLETNSLQI